MDKFITIGLIVCGALLFLTQLFNYYYHIGSQKKNIKNKIISIAPSTKGIIIFTSLYWVALIWMMTLDISPFILIILLFLCVQFTFAIFLTSNLYVFEEYLLVPWNHLEFKKVTSLTVTPSNKRNKLAISYEGGRVFHMSLKTKDLDILIDSMKKQNKKLRITKS